MDLSADQPDGPTPASPSPARRGHRARWITPWDAELDLLRVATLN